MVSVSSSFPLILQHPSATLHIKHLCWSHQKIMRSPDSYDTGECGWCGARDTVSMAITDRYQPTQQLSHTPEIRDTVLISELWCKYSCSPAGCGDCVLNYILSCIKPVTFGRVPAVSPDGPHLISRLTSELSRQFKHSPFSIILYNMLHKTPQNGHWWSPCVVMRVSVSGWQMFMM